MIAFVPDCHFECVCVAESLDVKDGVSSKAKNRLVYCLG